MKILRCVLLFLTVFSLGIISNASVRHALIYDGPGGCDGCAGAVAAMLNTMNNMTFEFVSPEQITEDKLAHATLYISPGGTDDDETTIKALGPQKVQMIRNYVASGGTYLGICAGAFLAGTKPDTDPTVDAFGFVNSVLHSELKDPKGQYISVSWKGSVISMYYQSGPVIDIDGLQNPLIWATYANSGDIAAAMGQWQHGRVGLIGPHPEATMDWFDDDHLTRPDHLQANLGVDFIESLLQK